MAQNKKMDQATQKSLQAWDKFTKVTTYSVVASIVLLIFLAIVIV